MQQITTAAAPEPGGHYSQAIRQGDVVYTAGQVGVDPRTGNLAPDLEGQVAQAIQNLAAVLEAAGGGLADVVKTTCFLTDIKDFTAFNDVYRQHFGTPAPARSTVGVDLAGALLFEIEAVAVIARPAP